MSLVSETTELTPAEVGEITGVTTVIQTDWRRLGVLPPRKDRSQTLWHLGEATWLFLMRELSDAGFTLTKASDAATRILPSAMAYLNEAREEGGDRGVDVIAGNYLIQVKLASQSPYKKPRYLSEFLLTDFDALVASAIKPTRYFVFTGQAVRGSPDPTFVLPLQDLKILPNDLRVWTVLDCRRCAEEIIKGVSRCLLARKEAR
ncbi:hypothetical protein NGM99_00240 [Mesorhizobium sp. RP14(2022)]|uniref:HTH merR-type domain-containing protein n=1 Tax=Mesorhizobium liriopis TaxID=2953882 RepID=A0ABT1C0A9_9HYPH|nr:hypothetical protein [Mesorhizobium liriopis]MCO6048217.1 hypothetical protein [Mesorhizobium liriopis]